MDKFENKVFILTFLHVPKGSQVDNNENFLFTEVFLLVNEEQVVRLDFETSKEIIDLRSNYEYRWNHRKRET